MINIVYFDHLKNSKIPIFSTNQPNSNYTGPTTFSGFQFTQNTFTYLKLIPLHITQSVDIIRHQVYLSSIRDHFNITYKA